MRRTLLAPFALCVLAASLFAAGCGSDVEAASAKGAQIAELPADTLPTTLSGLSVQHEDIEVELKQVRRSYAQAAGLWSLRRSDDRVQATLEIVRFFDEPRYTSASFRRTIVNQIGSSRPVETRMGAQPVYRTTGTKQTVALWFSGRNMLLLSIRDDLKTPRALIRRALEVEP
jgi:hypothetical protein